MSWDPHSTSQSVVPKQSLNSSLPPCPLPHISCSWRLFFNFRFAGSGEENQFVMCVLSGGRGEQLKASLTFTHSTYWVKFGEWRIGRHGWNLQWSPVWRSSQASAALADGGDVNSYCNDVRDLPWQIIWLQSDGQQFNVRCTKFLLNTDASRVAPFIVYKHHITIPPPFLLPLFLAIQSALMSWSIDGNVLECCEFIKQRLCEAHDAVILVFAV